MVWLGQNLQDGDSMVKIVADDGQNKPRDVLKDYEALTYFFPEMEKNISSVVISDGHKEDKISGKEINIRNEKNKTIVDKAVFPHDVFYVKNAENCKVTGVKTREMELDKVVESEINGVEIENFHVKNSKKTEISLPAKTIEIYGSEGIDLENNHTAEALQIANTKDVYAHMKAKTVNIERSENIEFDSSRIEFLRVRETKNLLFKYYVKNVEISDSKEIELIVDENNINVLTKNSCMLIKGYVSRHDLKISLNSHNSIVETENSITEVNATKSKIFGFFNSYAILKNVEESFVTSSRAQKIAESGNIKNSILMTFDGFYLPDDMNNIKIENTAIITPGGFYGKINYETLEKFLSRVDKVIIIDYIQVMESLEDETQEKLLKLLFDNDKISLVLYKNYPPRVHRDMYLRILHDRWIEEEKNFYRETIEPFYKKLLHRIVELAKNTDIPENITPKSVKKYIYFDPSEENSVDSVAKDILTSLGFYFSSSEKA